MRREAAAIGAVLAPLGRTVHWVRVTATLTLADYPYHLLTPTLGVPYGEAALDGVDETVDALLNLTSVGVTAESAREAGLAARSLLYPSGRPLRLTVPGRVVTVRWERFAVTQEDRSATLPTGTPGWPVIWVDQYRLVSCPA